VVSDPSSTRWIVALTAGTPALSRLLPDITIRSAPSSVAVDKMPAAGLGSWARIDYARAPFASATEAASSRMARWRARSGPRSPIRDSMRVGGVGETWSWSSWVPR